MPSVAIAGREDERHAARGECVGHGIAFVAIQVHVQHGGVEDPRVHEGKNLIDRGRAVTDSQPRSASMSSMVKKIIISSSTTRTRRPEGDLSITGSLRCRNVDRAG
jgi:hypothetical protein